MTDDTPSRLYVSIDISGLSPRAVTKELANVRAERDDALARLAEMEAEVAALRAERGLKRPENYHEFLQAVADYEADQAEALEDLIWEALTEANDLDVTSRGLAKAVSTAIRAAAAAMRKGETT